MSVHAKTRVEICIIISALKRSNNGKLSVGRPWEWFVKWWSWATDYIMLVVTSRSTTEHRPSPAEDVMTG